MPKINDTHSVLPANAAQRDSGSLYPLTETLTPGPLAVEAERETTDPAATHRTDLNLSFGLSIKPAGSRALGIKQEGGEQLTGAGEVPSSTRPAAALRGTETSQVLVLLSRLDNATLAELIEASGRQPHATCYRIDTMDAA